MTALRVTRTDRWPARAGLGLARSAILVVVCLLYMGAIALAIAFIRFLAVHIGSRQWADAFETDVVALWLGVIASSSPICGMLRWLVRRWTGITVADGYRPSASMVQMSTGYWWNGYRSGRTRGLARVRWWIAQQVRDPAAWRERAALLAPPFTVGAAAALPMVGIGAGIAALTRTDTQVRMLGVVLLAAGIGTSPYAWRAAASVLIRLLQPATATVLSARVSQLTEQRADATAAQAAELRRIERDLHDGAQARLVALGLTLTTAQRTIDDDPERAKALLSEATATTAAAVRELRDLVRGITPPVLSERGLTDALRALALDTPLPVTVQADPGFDAPLDAPIESALYFGTAELLTNAVKHAHAGRITIALRRRRDFVVIDVVDDGCGDARPQPAGGLAGVRRRLAAFDGTLSLDSPAGGPTRARMEVPWTSS